MTDIADIRTEIRNKLSDTDTTFTDLVIDQALRDALRKLSGVQGYDRIDTITVVTAGHELSLASLTSPAVVDQIWTPYTAASPENPPLFRAHAKWSPTLLYLPDHYLNVDDVARVFYHTPHTFNGLAGATATTIDDQQRGLCVIGAAHFACMAQHRALSKSINANPRVLAALLSTAKVHGSEFFDDPVFADDKKITMGRLTYGLPTDSDLDYGLPAWMLP